MSKAVGNQNIGRIADKLNMDRFGLYLGGGTLPNTEPQHWTEAPTSSLLL